MYKVFINEVLFLFTEVKVCAKDSISVLYKELDLQFFLNETHQNSNAKINVICGNLHNDWINFLKKFEIRVAAGGLVRNSKKEILWIYRFDKWDLPKGHVEKGESKEMAAIREVEEECNISGLVIDREIETTYHVFEQHGKIIMKITYWFLMHTNSSATNLVPQLDEGITHVCFKNKQESLACLFNTYRNIKLLLVDVL